MTRTPTACQTTSTEVAATMPPHTVKVQTSLLEHQILLISPSQWASPQLQFKQTHHLQAEVFYPCAGELTVVLPTSF